VGGGGQRRAEEGRGGQRRAEEGRGGQRRAEEGRGGQRRAEEGRGEQRGAEVALSERLKRFNLRVTREGRQGVYGVTHEGVGFQRCARRRFRDDFDYHRPLSLAIISVAVQDGTD
jgi:hypothetical protein